MLCWTKTTTMNSSIAMTLTAASRKRALLARSPMTALVATCMRSKVAVTLRVVRDASMGGRTPTGP